MRIRLRLRRDTGTGTGGGVDGLWYPGESDYLGVVGVSRRLVVEELGTGGRPVVGIVRKRASGCGAVRGIGEAGNGDIRGRGCGELDGGAVVHGHRNFLERVRFRASRRVWSTSESAGMPMLPNADAHFYTTSPGCAKASTVLWRLAGWPAKTIIRLFLRMR